MICKHKIHLLMCNRCYYDTKCQHGEMYYMCKNCNYNYYNNPINPRWDCNYIYFIIGSYLKSKFYK